MSARKLTDAQIEEAATLREKGWSIGRLAIRYGCSTGALYWHMLRLGADPPKLVASEMQRTRVGPAEVMRNGVPVRSYSPADDMLIMRLDAEGKGYTAIGRALSPPRKPNSVRARLMTLARHENRREAAREARA